jgi:hypothetical protein
VIHGSRDGVVCLKGVAGQFLIVDIAPRHTGGDLQAPRQPATTGQVRGEFDRQPVRRRYVVLEAKGSHHSFNSKDSTKHFYV